MTETTAMNALRTQVIAASGLANTKVLWAPVSEADGQAAPRPELPYITLNWQAAISQVAQDSAGLAVAGTGLVRVTGYREGIVTLNHYGDAPRTSSPALGAIRLKLWSELAQQAFRAAHVGLQFVGPTIPLAVLLETQNEDRAAMELGFSFVESVDENQGLIESTSVDVTLKRHPADSDPIEFTATAGDPYVAP